MFKRMKLAPKLAIVIGAILVLIFSILIIVTALLSKSAITNSISGELNSISKFNSFQIQQIFDAAKNSAIDMSNYLEKAYKTASEDTKKIQTTVPTNPEVAEICKSSIYNQVLSPINYDVEQYLSETARNTVINNDDIVGIGAMFEPYKFQSNMKDYAFYIDESTAQEKIKPFGSYEEYSKEIYYKEAASSKKSLVTDPYEFNGIKMVSYAIPIIYNNELMGVTMADINVDNFNKVEATSERYKSMYATIYDDTGRIVYDSDDLANIGKSMSEFTPNQSELAAVEAYMSQGQEFEIETTRENGKKVTKFFYPINIGDENWWSLTAVETSDVNKSVNNTIIMLIIISVLSLLLIIFIIVFVLKKMLLPMKNVVNAAENISKGKLDISISSTSEDEIGILSKTFQNMSHNLKKMVDDVKYLLEEMSEGNFNVGTKSESSYVGDFESFLISMRKLNDKLSDTLSQINQSSDQVASSSSQVSSGAQALSQGATEQASSIEELAATINEISSQVKLNAENAEQASNEANAVGKEANDSNDRMKDMLSAMTNINESSNEIGKIIKTIEDIAFQTNILALNAAVEAARAGEAGKGFSVVADEVRNLASKSAEASKNTSVLIESSVNAVQEGMKIADDTARSLENVVNGIKKATKTINQISTASTEQANSIEQVTLGIDQISNVVQTNSATAEESAAASIELSEQSQMLKNLVGQFKLKATEPNSLVRLEPTSSFEDININGKY